MTDSSHSVHAPVLGAWRLESFEVQRGADDLVMPFGPKPAGALIYHPTGQYSAQAMRTERPRFAAGDQMKGTVEEIDANYKGAISYFGRFECHEAEGYLIHHIEHSLFPNWEGESHRRFFELHDDQLTLRTPPTQWGGGGEIIAVLRWRRVG